MRQQDKSRFLKFFIKINSACAKPSYKNFCFLKASNSVSDIASQSALV